MKLKAARQRHEEEQKAFEREIAVKPVIKAGQAQQVVAEKRQQIA